LHRLGYGLARNDAWGNFFNGRARTGLDWTFTINGLSQWVDNTAQQCFTHRNIQNTARTFNDIAFF
jgi:hypothetical protein